VPLLLPEDLGAQLFDLERLLPDQDFERCDAFVLSSALYSLERAHVCLQCDHPVACRPVQLFEVAPLNHALVYLLLREFAGHRRAASVMG
jgi:hypothetical protein